ncbi:MAG: glycosyltransferase family 2 protein [Verrucomicrobia bacterium]|nr:glycosyltransferase family 2 protein [Verrucomicrobiota bacterium]
MSIQYNIDRTRWISESQGQVSGWLFNGADASSPDGAPITAVRLVSAGEGGRQWAGDYGALRPDVGSQFANHPAAAPSGFCVDLDAPDPMQLLHLEARDRAGRWHRVVTVDPVIFSPPEPPAHMRDTLTWEQCQQLHRQTSQLESRPLFSIVVPVYNPPERWLRAAIDSVRNQLYEDWELCLADDASPEPWVRECLADYARRDSRIKVVCRKKNGRISAATNSALALATGDFVVLLDHDDELTNDALAALALHLDEHPDADVIYSDHDKKDETGARCEPHFKPDWSPEYFRGVMYVGHLLCVRRTLLERVGGCDSRYDGVQDFDLMLRLSEQTTRIHHIPRILYHWRAIAGSIAAAGDAKSRIPELQASAVQAQLDRLGLPAHATSGAHGAHRVQIVPQPRKEFPPVSIIIATRDAPDFLERCLLSIDEKTTYPNFEVVLGDNDTRDPRALALMEAAACVRVPCPGGFNFSRINNRCAQAAAGDYLLFLNNDTELVTPDWIEQLLFFAEQADVGAVGPLLLYPDGGVQHAGVILGPRGTADHLMRHFPADSDGYAGSLVVSREVSAVTAACVLVRRELFEAVGGFEEHYGTHYQDVDLCLKLRAAGKRNIYTPNAVLVHHESVSRKTYYDHVDRHLLLDRWEPLIVAGDPFHNVNFDPACDDYRVRFQPRLP